MLEKFFDWITRGSIRFKWITITLTIVILAAGVFAVTQLKQELIPSIEFPQTIVLALNSGADPDAMLEDVTRPIEDAVSEIDGVVNVESTTSNGVSILIVRSEFGLDQDKIRDEIQASVEDLDYPEGMEIPELLTFSFADLPAASFSVSSDKLSLQELKDLVESEISPQLEGIEGVAAVDVSGGQVLPTEPPATKEPTPEPTPEPTATPTLTQEPTPTEQPTATPTDAPDEGAVVIVAVPLPDAWVLAGTAQGIPLETTDDLTPEVIDGVVAFAPQLLDELTPEMILVMPLDALEALPEEFLASLDQAVLAKLSERIATEVSVVVLEPLPLPDSWVQAGAAQGITLETTDDLTAEMIEGMAAVAPQMLEELTPEMLLVMPLDALAALPVDYIAGLDLEVQSLIESRFQEAFCGEGAEPLPLPDSWVEAAAAQGASLETTADLTAEVIDGIAAFAPQMLDELTPEVLLVMPLDAVEALPEDYIAGLDADVRVLLEKRVEVEPCDVMVEAVPLPDSWALAGAAQGITLETTDDLTAEVIEGIVAFAPEMLAELTPEMLLAMPLDALAALPEEFIAGLDPELQSQLAERVAAESETESAEEEPAEAEVDPRELPAAWQTAGETQGIILLYPEDVTPEIVQGISQFAPGMFAMLTPDHLRELSPESIGWLPMEFVDSLDPELRTELDEIAAEVGGAGALAVAAEAEGEELAADAPELTGAWRQAPPEDAAGPEMPDFETAADLMTTGFSPTAAGLLNMLLENAGELAPDLMGDLTLDVIAWLVENEDDFLENLDPAALRLLSPEVLAELPEEFLASLDEDLREELEGIAAGTVEVFIPTSTINRVNGNPSLNMSVFQDQDANTVAVSHEIFDKLDELEADNEGLHFEIIFEQASFIEESINGVTREGILGAVFAVIVILFFLSGLINGSYKLAWRSTLVIAVSIPLSIFITFALMKWFPPLVNPLFDPLVDATRGIPIVGAVFLGLRNLFPAGLTLNIMTLSGITVAIGRVVDDSIVVLENIYRHIQRGEDRKQSVLIGTRDVSMAIFASTLTTVVVFLPIGLLGGLIGEFFLPFGIAVTYALASSFLVAITVVPLLAYLFIRKEHLPEEKETGLKRRYTPVLEWALSHRFWVLAIASVLLVGSVFLFATRPQAFLPDFGETQVNVTVDLNGDVTMAETDALVAGFEEVLQDVEGIKTVSTEIGSSGGIAAAFMGSAIDQGQAGLQISVENVEDVDGLVADVRGEAEAYFGTENVTVSSGSLMSSGAFGGFALVAAGEYEDLAAFNAQAIETLNTVEGLANVTSNLADETTFLRVDGQPALRYTGELETRDTLGVTQSAKEALLLVAPDSVTISEGFESQQQTEGFSQAIFAIGISIVIVYLVLVATFGSFIHPFTILFSLPLAVIGAAVALWLADSIVGLSSLVGMMMLVGIVVTNAIVLIDRVQNNRRKRGMSIYDALVEGGRTRIRPILMTAIAAVLALVPLAVGLSDGAIIASDLAIVVIGGLTTSTILTLVVVPVMYSLLDRFDPRNRKLEAQAASVPEVPQTDIESGNGESQQVKDALESEMASEKADTDTQSDEGQPDQGVEDADFSEDATESDDEHQDAGSDSAE